MTRYCKACGEPLPRSWVCFVCEHEAALGRRLDRIPAVVVVEVEQPRMFEVPRAKPPRTKDLYEAAQRHGDAA